MPCITFFHKYAGLFFFSILIGMVKTCQKSVLSNYCENIDTKVKTMLNLGG